MHRLHALHDHRCGGGREISRPRTHRRGRIRADPAVPDLRHQPDRSDRRSTGPDAGAGSRSAAQPRSRTRARRGRNDGGPAGILGRARAAPHRADRRLRSGGAAARRGGRLRNALVPGGDAPPRDRGPHGPGRQARRGARSHRAAGNGMGGLGCRARRRGGARRGPVAPGVALRSSTGRPRDPGRGDGPAAGRGLAASWLPARRAASVAPMEAIREE